MSHAPARRSRCAPTFLTLTAALLCFAGTGTAQETPKPDTPKPSATKPTATKPDAPKPDAPKPSATKPEVKPEAPKPEAPKPSGTKPPAEVQLREQTIYIPYTKLREIFETEKRGVFLPYDKFQELWKAAREKQAVQPDVKPPVAVLISEVANEAVVSRDVVKVKAKIKIELLSVGWHEVPLRLADAAITSATIDGKPARILFDKFTGYKLVVERTKDGPQTLELALDYAKTFTKRAGTNTVSFESPQAPVSKWQVRLDEPGVKIDIHPLIAASDVPAADPKQPKSEILAFVGAAETVRIDWTPRAEGATGLEVLAGVQTEEQVNIDETAIHTRATLLYTISRASLAQLKIDVPATHRVANVFDSNVKRWSVEKPAADPKADAAKATTQRILIELFEPAKQTQSIVVELELIAEAAAARTSVIPVISAVDVARQQGVVVVQVADGLRAEPERRTGLIQLDSGELPNSMSTKRWAFSYRYATVPFDLALKIEKVQPRITTELLVEADLQPDKLVLETKARINIEKAGIFTLELEIPKGFEISEARGFSGHELEPLAVDGFRVEGTDRNKVVFNLTRKAIGKVGLQFRLTKPLSDPELKTPMGKEASLALTLPRFAQGTVERTTGSLIVHAPESLRVNPGEAKGLRTVSFQEALQALAALRSTAPPNTRPVQAFTFADAPAELTLAVERRKPHVTVRQFLTARVEAGVVKYTAQFFHEILYSPVRSLRIDIPEKIVGSVHNDTAGVRESVVAPPPADLEAGYVAWSLAGESEFLGNVVLTLSWETPLDKLEVGANSTFNLPHLKPKLVDRAWGQIVLMKAEAIDLADSGELKSLRPIDPQQDLMPGASAPGAARAFEFHEDWALAVTATRYKLEEVKRTTIERAVVRGVVTRSKQTSVQALYQLRSARQRLALKLPAGASFEPDPVKIDGKSVPLESGGAGAAGGQGDYFIPLVGQSPDKPLVLELRYTLKDQATTFDLPAFPEDPAVQQVYLCTYLPEEWAVIRADGPWTDEVYWMWGGAPWRYTGGVAYRPVPKRNDAQLVQWVTQGVSVQGNPLDNFRQDGRLLVFSALHPEAPPAGSLTLVTVHRTLLNSVVLLVILGGGLLLLRTKLATRAMVAGCAIVAFVVLEIFQPMLVLEMVNGIFQWSIGIVVVGWIVVAVICSRCCRTSPTKKPGSNPPPPPPPSPPAAGAPVAPVPPPAPITPPVEGAPPVHVDPAAPASWPPGTPASTETPPSDPTPPPEPGSSAEPTIGQAPTVTPPVTPPPDDDEAEKPKTPDAPPPEWAAREGGNHV
jgi:hypothetical protein